MRRLMMTAVALILTSVFAIAGDTQWQFDRNKVANMSVSELDALADTFRAQKNYADANRLLWEAVRRQPKDALLVNKLGVVELQVRDYHGAAVHFKKAIKLNSKYADALNNLGAVYFLENNLNKAAQYYQKALAVEEARATFHVNLAATFERQNKLNLALAEYQRALEIDADVLTNSSTRGAVAQPLTPEQRATRFFVLAKVCALRGDIDGALDYLKKAKDESYRDLRSVYKQQEFAKLWSDPRLSELIPAR